MHPEQLGIYGYPGSTGHGASGGAPPSPAGPPACGCGMFAVGRCLHCNRPVCQTHSTEAEDRFLCTSCADPATLQARLDAERQRADNAAREAEAAARRAAAAAEADRQRRALVQEAERHWGATLGEFLKNPHRKLAPVTFTILERSRSGANGVARARPWNRGPNTHPDGTYRGTVAEEFTLSGRPYKTHWKVFDTEVWVLPGQVKHTRRVPSEPGHGGTDDVSVTELDIWLRPSGRVLLPHSLGRRNLTNISGPCLVKVLDSVDQLVRGSAGTEEELSAYPVEALYDHLRRSR